jgi:hypothetical protein
MYSLPKPVKAMRFGWANAIKLFLAFLIGVGLHSCGMPNTTELTKVFQPVYNGKMVKTQVYNQGSGFCSSTVFVNSDSTFTYERGCEGDSHVGIGKWFLIKDSIKLTALERSPKNLSFKLTTSKSSADKYVTFIIQDKTHKPIEDFIIQSFNKNLNENYVDGVGLTISSSNGLERFNQFKTDSLGILKIIKNKSDSLDFTKLYPLTGKAFRIRNHNLPDTIKLIININGAAFSFNQLSYANDMANHRMTFKYVNGKMIY